MGVAITELLEGKTLEIKEITGKRIAIDAFNTIYQFLTVLRGPDGEPLKNSKGQITSHLKGLLSRNIQFLKEGLKPIYIFDGESPELKREEKERRNVIYQQNKERYDLAKERNDFEGIYKYSQRLQRITPEIIESSKKLLDLLGIPWVQAKSEGEAQAAYLVLKNDADFVVSQDADALLFGSPYLIRNINGGKKKKKGKLGYDKILPRIYSLSETLNQLGLDKEQLIILAILVGTDYNVGGIKGLGPKKALKLVKENGKNFDEIFNIVKCDFDWRAIKDIFENIPYNTEYEIEWKDIQKEKLISWLKNEYEFSEESLTKTLQDLDKVTDVQKQKGLTDFF
jgi:flap endonuclease-1